MNAIAAKNPTQYSKWVQNGLKTLKQCKKARLKGIVIRGKQNVFLNKSKCINFANKNKMFITAK
jgi:DUF1009 family protein